MRETQVACDGAMTLDVVTSLDAFRQLAGPWHDLYRRAGCTEVFLDHRWLDAWFTCLAGDTEMRVFVVRTGERLTAALPLVLETEKWSLQTERTLRLPIGQESGNLRCDFIVTGDADGSARLVADWLYDQRKAWDRLELLGFTAGSTGMAALLRGAMEAGLEVRDVRVNCELYYVPVQGKWPDYARDRGRKFRSNMRLANNRLNREPDIVVETTIGGDQLPEAFAKLQDIDEISTKSGLSGMVPITGHVGAFYRQLVQQFGSRGGCRIDILKIGGRPVASLMSLLSEGCIFLLHNSITPEARFFGGGRILWLRLFTEMFALRNAPVHPAETVPEVDINARTVFARTFGQGARAIIEGRIMSGSRRSRIAQWRNTHVSPALQARRRRHRYIPLTPIFWRPSRTLSKASDRSIFPQGNIRYYENGRTALDAGLRSLGLERGDRILFPNYHCGSEYEVLLRRGFDLVYYPVERNLDIDFSKVEALCDGSIKAIYLIHHLGWPQNTTRMRELADKWGVPLIEDCAQMLYSDVAGRPAGAHSDLVIFSLHKFLPLADGGVAITRPTVRAPLPAGEPLSGRDALTLGLKQTIHRISHASRWCAAAGILLEHAVPFVLSRFRIWCWAEEGKRMTSRSLRVFEKLDHEWIKQRRTQNYQTLANQLAGLPGIELAYPKLEQGVVPLLFPFFADNPGPIIEALTSEGIEAGIHWSGIDTRFPLERFPETIFLKSHLVAVPLHQELSDTELSIVANTVRRACGKSDGETPTADPAAADDRAALEQTGA